ncbi:MAG: cation diffusion facilitator family transporter [Candidatus Heimdallarchaeota archaeon]|nr:MAG: cation diffusion facilitator family transporter [Candidatus Heimdallarchaeota archaeon]
MTMICNSLLIIFKIIGALLIGSVSLLASGLDALTDLTATFMVFLGLRFSQKDPSKRFPYGYYRMETLATLIMAIFILLFGLHILSESIHAIFAPSELFQPIFGLLVSLVSILSAFGLYRYNLKIGNKIASSAMIGTAKEFQLDIVTNSLVFLGIFAHMIEFPQLEGLIGLLIGVFIIKTGISFGKSSLLILIDAIDDPDIIEQIRAIILQFSEVLEVSNIRIRRSGPYYFADINIQMDTTETIKSINRVTHHLESSLKKNISLLDSIMISVEPILKTRLKVAIAVTSLDSKIDKSPADHFGIAPAFLIADIDIPSQKVISTQIVENPHRLAERKRGILSAELLTEKEIDILLIKDLETFGVGPKAILTDNNIQLEPSQGNTIFEILERFIIYQTEVQKSYQI